jgi:hypothetical protein
VGLSCPRIVSIHIGLWIDLYSGGWTMKNCKETGGLFGDQTVFKSDNGQVITQKELQFILRNLSVDSDKGRDMKTALWLKVSRALGADQ